MGKWKKALEAARRPPSSIWVQLGRYLVLLSFLILIVGLLSTSYSSALALSLGILSGVLLLRLAKELFPLTKSLFLSIVARIQGWNWRRWIQQLSIALVLWPFYFYSAGLVIFYLPSLFNFYLFDFVPFIILLLGVAGFSLLLSIQASVEAQSFLSFLSAQVQSRGWWGWIWIQRLLMMLIFSIFFFPLLLLLLVLPWDIIPSWASSLLSVAGLALVLGILLTWRVEGFLLSVTTCTQNQRWRRWIWKQRFLISFIWSAFFCLLWTWGIWVFLSPMIWGVELPVAKTYHVVIEPMDPALRSFRVREEIVPYSSSSGKQTLLRQATSTSRGFLLREVRIAPLDVDSSGYVNLTFPDGTSVKGLLCGDYCPQSTIELHNFPKNSYYDTKNAEVESRDTYINTETVSLSIHDLDQGVVFAYIPPPYHHLRPVLAPFVGLSSFGEYIIASLGLVCAVIVLPIIQPALADVVKEKFKSRFKKEPQKKEGKKATLIISGKGEEKEIEIIE